MFQYALLLNCLGCTSLPPLSPSANQRRHTPLNLSLLPEKSFRFIAIMKFAIVAALLNLAAVQAAAIPSEATPAAESVEFLPNDDIKVGVPKMITPKYRKNAKRAIIRYPAFTLAAKGVSKTKSSCR
jgi:hypothetical protein